MHSWQHSPYSVLLGLAAVLASGLAVVVWRRRTTPGAVPFGLLLIAAAEWAAMVAFEHAAIPPATKIFYAKLEYPGILSVSPLWLTFALAYTEQRTWLVRRRLGAVWVIPLIGLALVWTNEWHGLIWTAITPVSDLPGAPLVYRHGAAFWAAAGYNYVLNLLGTIILVRAVVRFPREYRSQSVALVAGLVIPWVGNALYLSGSSPLRVDTTPLAFTLTGLIYVVGVFRLRLLELVPIARDRLVESMADGVLVLDAQDRVIDMNPRARVMLRLGEVPIIGERAKTIFGMWPELVEHPPEPDDARVELEVGPVEDPHYLDLQISALRDGHGRFQGRLIVLRDITARKHAEERSRLQARTEERLRQMETLLAMSEAVASTLELTEVFRRSTRAMVRALDADMGGAWVLSATRDEMIPLAGYRVPKEILDRVVPMSVPAEDPLVAEILALKGPIYAADSQRDRRFDHPWAHAVPHQSVLVVPLRLRDETVGGFTIVWTRSQHAFTVEEQRLTEVLAAHAATAIENARLHEARAVFAQEEERRRLAYELHDAIGQLMVSAKQHVEACRLLWNDNPAAARTELGTGIERLVQAIRETRQVLRTLASPVIDELGLVEAVRRTLHDVARDAGWNVELDENLGEERLPPTVALAAFRIIREALANAAGHAEAPRVRIGLYRKSDRLELSVRDDGRGFAGSATTVERGLGLASMEERARLVGGRVTIESVEGRGTTIMARLPITKIPTK